MRLDKNKVISPSSASVVPYEQLFLSMQIELWLLLSLTSYSAAEPNICDSSSAGQEKKFSQPQEER